MHINTSALLPIGASNMYKPNDINEKDLPLSLLGQEAGTFSNVYSLTELLNSDLQLSLKSNGYINREAKLLSGEVVKNSWVK